MLLSNVKKKKQTNKNKNTRVFIWRKKTWATVKLKKKKSISLEPGRCQRINRFEGQIECTINNTIKVTNIEVTTCNIL